MNNACIGITAWYGGFQLSAILLAISRFAVGCKGPLLTFTLNVCMLYPLKTKASIDKLGRKKLLLLGAAGMLVALLTASGILLQTSSAMNNNTSAG
jgi:hypothetical protein